ncbi:lysozyme inhibitor LprI family protein [Salinisphaera sp.]|uniref:lysozyme inhibitor LprI family protein n=1 Tax=Salinisphaera sp. TaxID=1914330 RepID=UPI002D771083|nr:lysozyme inhibitor LprI family protein [Salinisphaera sp.]HET7314479.1 lysozyme inhibitor LprI family protein [Salinisphaera sp.]
MNRHWAACAAVGLLVLPWPAAAWNWAYDDSERAQGAEFAQSKAICRRLEDRKPPPADRPDAAQRKKLAGCDAGALYYGIGEPRQPERARQCAFIEAEQAGDDAGDRSFFGLSVLMMIYANGRGAERDLDLATALACRIHGPPAEVDHRVKHLHKLAAKHWQGHDFDYCDDIITTMSANLCAARNASMVSAKREARLDRIAAGWPADVRRAFAGLRDAEQVYAKTSADNEVDLTGTARAILTIHQGLHLHKVFEQLLNRLEKGDLPAGAAADYKPADTRLNEVYRRIMALKTPPDERGPYGTADSLPWITVTHAGIRKTERVWLRYREAWVDFAKQRYPDLPADALRAVLTRQRIDELKPFLAHS